MCPSMEMNPWALMTPCKEDNKGSVNPTGEQLLLIKQNS